MYCSGEKMNKRRQTNESHPLNPAELAEVGRQRDEKGNCKDSNLRLEAVAVVASEDAFLSLVSCLGTAVSLLWFSPELHSEKYGGYTRAGPSLISDETAHCNLFLLRSICFVAF